MTAPWALPRGSDPDEVPLEGIAAELVARFADGAARPHELPALGRLAHAVAEHAPLSHLEPMLRELSHQGYLRGAIVVLADALHRVPRIDLALRLARELIDALDPELGIRLVRAVLGRPDVVASATQPRGPHVAGNLLLGEALLAAGDPSGSLRHYEAVLAVDVDHPRALLGVAEAEAELARRGRAPLTRSRGLALLDGLAELDLQAAFGDARYEIRRPLGRGRHAVVYEAHDRHVGRPVALKRLLDADLPGSQAPRVLRARFFAEARTLARVRSPYVVALLDAQPKHRFIALQLCEGGNLRQALRRGLVGPLDMPRIAAQLRAALAAVHAAGAVHRDVKPANILVRRRSAGSPIALADFGLATGREAEPEGPGVGTLRYLAPELRRGGGRATAASDRFAAGVVLLELLRYPAALPDAFDRMDDELDAAAAVPDDTPAPWADALRRVLARDPEARTW